MRDYIGEILGSKTRDYIGEILGRREEEDLLKPPGFLPAETVTTTVAKPGDIATEEELFVSQPIPKMTRAERGLEVDVLGPVRGVVYTINTAPQAVGSLIKEYGERMEENPDFWDFVMSTPTMGLSVIQKKVLSGIAKKNEFDEKIASLGDDIIKRNETYIQRLTSIHPRTGKVNELLFGLGSGATSLAGAIGLSYLTKSPHAAAIAFGAYQKSMTYREAREAGLEPKQAGRISTVAGAVEGGLEYVGLNLILGKYAGNLLGTMATEAFQEFSQEVGSNLVAKHGYDKARNIWQGAWESALMGAILGGPASLVTGTIRNTEVGAAFRGTGVDVGDIVEDAQKRITPELVKIAKEDFIKATDEAVTDLVKREKALKVEEAEVVAKPTIGLLTRIGDITGEGAYFGIVGQTTYEGGENYILSTDTKIADLTDVKTANEVIRETLKDKRLTKSERSRLQEAINQGDIDYLLFDETPMSDAVKRLGYDAATIRENTDMPGEASSVFVVNLSKISSTERRIVERPLSETERAKVAEEEAAKRKVFEPEKPLWQEMVEPTKKKEFVPSSKKEALEILNRVSKKYPATMGALKRYVDERNLNKIKSIIDDIEASAFKAPDKIADELYEVRDAIYTLISKDVLDRFPRFEEVATEELQLEREVVRKPRAKKVQTEFEEAVKPRVVDEYIQPTEVKDVEASREKLETSSLFEATVPATPLTLGGQKLPAIDAKMQMSLAKLGYPIGLINRMSLETAGELLRNKIRVDKVTIETDGSFRLRESEYKDPFTGDPVTKEEYEFLTGGDVGLYEAIMIVTNRKGIRSYEKTGAPGQLREEYRGVPIHLRGKNGFALDEVADMLKREFPHLGVESERSLLDALSMEQDYRRMHAGLNLREAWEGVKGLYSSKVGQPAFDLMSKLVPKTLKKYFTPYYGWNEYVKYLYRDMLYDRIGRLAEASEVMGKVSKLNPEEKIATYYLATKQPLPEGIRSTPRAEEVSKLVNTEFNKLGDEAVKLGLMPEASFRKFFDRYLPRLYEIYERNKAQPSAFRQSLRMDLERFMHRSEDLPVEWREAAGEIKNVEELFSRGVIKEVYDITLNKFQKRLRVLPAELTEGMKVVVSTAEAKALEELGQFDINNYHRLPDSKHYGDLRNSYIRNDVWSEIKGMYRTPGQWDDIIRIHNKLLTLWKMGKTVFSPATQMRNFYFGILQCDMGDGWDAKAIREFARAIATKNETYKELRKQGILSSGMVQEEMLGYLNRLKKSNNRFEKVIDFSTDVLMEKLQGKRAAQLYGASDDLFRSLIYVSQRQKGKAPEVARDLANFYMVNYREIGPAIKFLRMGPSPFATFYNGFIQAAAHTAIVKPWKPAKWYLLLWLLGSRGLREAKELRERKREAMPQYIPELIPDIVPAYRLPWKTQRGEDLFLDLTYVIPFLDMGVEFFRMAKGELKPLHPGVAAVRASVRLINHPGFRWLADVAIHGVDPFTRTELDTPGKIFDYTYKQLMPNLAPEIPFTGIEGGWGYAAFKKAIEKRPTTGRGYVRGIPETVGRHVLGIKTIPVDYTEELNSRIRYATYLISESEDMIRRVAKNKSLTSGEKHRETQAVVKEIGRLGDLIKNWKEQRDWFVGQGVKSPQRDYIGEILGK